MVRNPYSSSCPFHTILLLTRHVSFLKGCSRAQRLLKRGDTDFIYSTVRNGGFDLYINNGHADTSVPGDAIFLADLDGDGLDDYISSDNDGKIIAYLNGGPDPSAYLGWSWKPQNKGDPIALGVGARRDQIRFANIYGHGRADYLVIDDESGAVEAWENGGPDDSSIGAWKWIPRGQIATGIGEGAGVRFADYDGDGRDDYIWLSEEGKAIIYINYVGEIAENWKGLNDGKYIALGVGARREDVQIADLDGDGRADYIWVHPFDGSINVWRNAFDKGPGTWEPYDKKLALGVGVAGANVHFARLNGEHTGRADYVVVEPGSGGLRVWLNLCDKLAPGKDFSEHRLSKRVMLTPLVLRPGKQRRRKWSSCRHASEQQQPSL